MSPEGNASIRRSCVASTAAKPSRREFLGQAASAGIAAFLASSASGASVLHPALRPPKAAVEDKFTFLPPGAVHFEGYFDDYIRNSLAHWNKGVVPYAALVQLFRTGRLHFAQGEMWGKAVRSGALFYRYTQDAELKSILSNTVSDFLTTKRANGSYSCSEISQQPESKGGDLWERTYVLLGLDGYYMEVESDPEVLQAMVDEADCTIAQIGHAPKIEIVDQGWSANHIESSTILEPILRLYKLTGEQRYLEFATYIVKDGGAKGYNVIEEAFENKDPEQIGGPYPKAYEMMSLFEGIAEYYRITGSLHYRQALLNLFHKIIQKEITLIGNGGGDQPFMPAVHGEAWDYTALEQTNPTIDRMMETCSGVTWLKLCSQICRLTGDPSAIDAIEKYAYNGLIGAMKPGGDGFSYVNKLNGVKTNPKGWGGTFEGVYVTCCNLNGPTGLGYLPLVAVMQSNTGPVINLYNKGQAVASSPRGQSIRLGIETNYPLDGTVTVEVSLPKPERFTVHLRIPGWGRLTKLTVNGVAVEVSPGTYAELHRSWASGDIVRLVLDMSTRLISAPHGSDRRGDNFVALVRGPIVLARDENIDPNYDKPIKISAESGSVTTTQIAPTLENTRMQFRVPTSDGEFIQVVDYASINNWNGKHICTWMPISPSPAST